MAYFLNQEEREKLNIRCKRCLFGREKCPIRFVQDTFNFEANNNEIASGILNSLIKNDGECSVFKIYKEYLEIEKGKSKKEELETIYKNVCDHFKLDFTLIKSKSKLRDREIAKIRQIAHFFAKKFTPYSYSEIGIEIGQKNHATVIHSYKTVKNFMKLYPAYRNDIMEIKEKYFEKYVL